MAVVFKNNASTTLNGAIDGSQTSIVVTSGAVFPQVVARSAIAAPTAGSASYADTTKGVWSLDNNLNNDISGGVALSSAGAHTATTTVKFGSHAYASTGDYTFTPALYAQSSAYSVGDGDFTFDFWFYKYSGGYGGGSILNIYTANNNYITLVAFPSSTGTLYGNRSGTTTNVATTGSFAAVNTWAHVALERYNGLFYIYSGGTRILNGGNLTTGNPTLSGTPTIVFGGQNGNGTGAYSSYGILDECRFCTTAKYGGVASFTPPVAAYTDDGIYNNPVQYSSSNTTDAGDYFYATITDGTNTEVVKVTNVSSNTLTVERGQEGTSGTAFGSGSTIEIRPTNQGLIDLRNDQLYREVAYSNNKYLGAI